MTLDKTWQEIYDAPLAVIKLADPEDPYTITYYSVYSTFVEYGSYGINVGSGTAVVTLGCDEPDGYPSTDFGDDDPITT